MQIKYEILAHAASIPSYKTPGSAGLDISAAIHEPLLLREESINVIPTGIILEIPYGYEGQIRSRSGLAANHGVIVFNSPGTIDSDYRGEIKVILKTTQPFLLERGMRIAQLVISKVEHVILIDSVIQTTDRGGFGSTGLF